MLITATTEILASIMCLFLQLAAIPYGGNALMLIKFPLKKFCFHELLDSNLKRENLKNMLY